MSCAPEGLSKRRVFRWDPFCCKLVEGLSVSAVSTAVPYEKVSWHCGKLKPAEGIKGPV